ncbi:MAG TPA: hypothetical protein PKJ41_14195 [Bryobacteraceae bacterium]|nr:hypothetical protein [Bryobacteraceae bacterium]HPT24994.1 hypothetical protein [Bryobacteraceae bacterium]
MSRTILHRISLALVTGLFLALAQGVVETGQTKASQPHLVMGIAVGLLAMVWSAAVRKTRPEAFALSILVLGAIAASGWSGMVLTPAAKVAHAVFSHLAFGLAAGGAAMTSESWEAKLAFADGGFPTLRSLAWITPAAVTIQVALGAAYRHQMTGLIPHVAWAFVAAMAVIMTAAFTMTQCGKHPALRRLSIALISITAVQLVLGVTALFGRMAESSAGSAWRVIAAASHVLAGAVVLALTLALAAQTLRHVEPVEARGLAATGQNG